MIRVGCSTNYLDRDPIEEVGGENLYAFCPSRFWYT